MIYAGIDAGSRAIKIVLLEEAGPRVRVRLCVPQGASPARHVQEAYARLLEEQGLRAADVAGSVATGYARASVKASTTITEITCHAAGVHHLLPQVRTVVEIGGQDSKLLRLTDSGSVRDFAMNDRCAAGTGRFLELAAERLECSLADLGALASAATAPAAVSSMCAVFAETEIIGLLASGVRREDIVAGVQQSIAARISAMAGGELAAPVAFTGGVAMVAGMGKALSVVLGQEVIVPPDPQFTGALGAALLAWRGLRL